ncbi:lipoprotein [Vibrio echinoideorum]|uniref:lipoprotein n=1 Tax=Vibrio echinoideorum TaxID=2100116 RepID=UPI001080F82B|nr:lipoprotein [Vibrio echinoideorum]
MKKSALFVALIAVLLTGCNSSDSSDSTGGTAPHNPGTPILPPGDGDGSTGDQTDPDEDTDFNPSKDPLIIEAAQRWGTTYDEMYNACQLWTCNLAEVQERITFTIERETQLLEGSAKVTFTLSHNNADLWPTYVFYSDLIGSTDIEVEHTSSTFSYVSDDKIVSEGSTLLGWKTGFGSWATQNPRDCVDAYCAQLKTSWLETGTYSNAMAVYRKNGEVINTQRGYLSQDELRALYPVFSPTFPDQY